MTEVDQKNGMRGKWIRWLIAGVLTLFTFYISNRDFLAALRASEHCSEALHPTWPNYLFSLWPILISFCMVRVWINVLLLGSFFRPQNQISAHLKAALKIISGESFWPRFFSWEPMGICFISLVYAFTFSNCQECSFKAHDTCGTFFMIFGSGIACAMMISSNLLRYKDVVPP